MKGAGLLLALPCLLYLALPTRNFYWDGVAFAISIENQSSAAALVHPNHLAYTLFSSWIYHLTHALGFSARALFVMQAVNGLLAGLSVGLLYAWLRLRQLPANVCFAGALLFAFSATWWRFATDANAYIPSILFMLTALILAERGRGGGVALSAAILFHELAIFLVPVALLFEKRRAEFLASVLVPVGVAYVGAYCAVSADPTLGGLITWVTSHSPDSGFSFHPLDSLGYTIRGTFRLFFGGKVGDFVGDGVSYAALIAAVIAAVGCVRFGWAYSKAAPIPRCLFVWIGIFVAFLLVWMPQNTFYRLFYLPPLIAILGLTLGRATWLLVPVVFFWNFAFVTYPQSRPEFNAPLRFALAQQSHWPSGSAIVFHKFHPDLWTISYFNNQAAWISIDGPEVTKLEPLRPLWLEETAYALLGADPAGQRWLAEHEQPGELVEFRDSKHHFRFHRLR